MDHTTFICRIASCRYDLPVPQDARHFHLHAAGAALALGGLLIATLFGAALHLEHRYFDALAQKSFELKDQGLALQKEAFARPDVLPLYGSSELVKPISDKASIFFKRYPTDFTVSPVGKQGATSLIIAEKLAAIGAPLRGRRVAVSLSPSFFLAHEVRSSGYTGNFSTMQAGECIFGSELSPELRREYARRMSQFPGTLRSHALLSFAIQRLVAGTPCDRLLYDIAVPFGRAVNAIVRLQDHLATGTFIVRHLGQLKAPPHRGSELDWEHLVERWTQRSTPFRPRHEDQVLKQQKLFPGDADFVARLERSAEWADLDLLIRTLRELGAKPLILGIPMNGLYFDGVGISASARRRYYEMLEALAAREHVAVLDFREHELDARFFADTHDHLSPKGWIYFDQALDAFYHDRPLSFVSR